jgi:hypothetical protein
MVRVSVDRIEGDWLILVPDSGPNFQIPASLFPGLQEKDVVTVSIEKDVTATQRETEEIEEIRKGLNTVELT